MPTSITEFLSNRNGAATVFDVLASVIGLLAVAALSTRRTLTAVAADHSSELRFDPGVRAATAVAEWFPALSIAQAAGDVLMVCLCLYFLVVLTAESSQTRAPFTAWIAIALLIQFHRPELFLASAVGAIVLLLVIGATFDKALSPREIAKSVGDAFVQLLVALLYVPLCVVAFCTGKTGKQVPEEASEHGST